MDTNRTPRPDGASRAAASDDAAASFQPAHRDERSSEAESASRRTDEDPPPDPLYIEPGRHMPAIVDPLVPQHPDTAFTETRHYRRDGWTPERKRLFLARLAECGVIVEACEAAGMSARSAYNLRDRDPLFAAGMEAASVMARPYLAHEAWSRALNGVVERIYRDGVIVAERHRYDNRLTMSVLARLDARIDRAEEKGAPHLNLIPRWDDYLDALAEDRSDDALALLAPPEPEPVAGGEVQEKAEDHELRELHEGKEADMEPEEEDRHHLWEEEDGTWWTTYPPPAGFDGEEDGRYGSFRYRRTLSPEEQAALDADIAEERAEDLARGEAQRAAYFGFAAPEPDAAPSPAPPEEEAPEEEAPAEDAPGARAAAPASPPPPPPPEGGPPRGAAGKTPAAGRSHACHETPPVSPG